MIDPQVKRGISDRARWRGILFGMASAAVVSTTTVSAQDVGPPSPPEAIEAGGAQNAPAIEEMTPELDGGVNRGLEALAGMQNADGSFGRGRYGRHVGITAICALAFMADGHVPERGRYEGTVRKALDFVLAGATETGLLAAETSHGPMYGHGFATLFLGEIYGMNPSDERVRDALGRAIRLIVDSQNEEGGWRYNPVPLDADVSVTICEIMALRSARNAGIKVPRETIDKAVEYVRQCQNPDGGFRYMTQAGGSAWPRTAAGVASLFYAGIYEDDAIELGLEYLVRKASPGRGVIGAGSAHYFYGQYYSAQAMYLAGGEWWSDWWPAIRTELLSRQNKAGEWTDRQIGDAYATAMALIVLQMPKRYLPIFQK
ncbi:MAG: prenyltransferase [Phycisphaerae bacterium]|nr:prenyltransferase [Phycisphaerae bacterium]